MKTIKFNLPLQKPDAAGKYPIAYASSIEELRDNFDPQGLLFALKHNNLLTRWLEVRGYSDELTKIKELQDKADLSDTSKVKAMAKIFQIDMPESDLDQLLVDLDMMQQNLSFVQEQISQLKDVQKAVSDSNKRYLELIKGILDHPQDLDIVKQNIRELKAHFLEFLTIDRRSVFWVCYEKAPLALLVMLADPDLRQFYLDFDFLGKAIPNDQRAQNVLAFSAQDFSHETVTLRTYDEELKKLFHVPLDELSARLGSCVRSARLSMEWNTFEPEGSQVICLHVETRYGDEKCFCCAAAGNNSDDPLIYTRETLGFNVLNGLQARTETPREESCLNVLSDLQVQTATFFASINNDSGQQARTETPRVDSYLYYVKLS